MAEPTDAPTTEPPRTADGTPLWTPVTEHNGITFAGQQTPPPSATGQSPPPATSTSQTPPTTEATPPSQQPPPSGQLNPPIDPTQGSPTGSTNDNVPIPPLAPPPNDSTKLDAGSVMPADGLKNGDYSLRMVEGNLVLSGPEGRIWESATNRNNAFLLFRTDGSFDIGVSSSSSGYSVWSNGLKLDNVGSLQLTDKGKLVILDKNGKEIHTIAAADGVKHYAVVSIHIPAGSPWWLESLIGTIDAWFQKAYDLLGAGKPGEIVDLFKLITNQGLLDPRKERNTGKLVEQYSKKGDFIAGVKNQLQQGNAQIQILSLNQIPEKIGQTRIKLDRIVDELNDKLRHVDPEAVITGKEMKSGAAAAAVDALYQAVGRAAKELKAVSDFIAEKEREVKDNVPATDQTGSAENGSGVLPPGGFGGAPPPGQDMKPLYGDLLGGDDPTEKDTGNDALSGTDIDALLKDIEGDSAPTSANGNGNGGAPAPAQGSNPLAGLMGLMPLLPMVAQMINQMRPQNLDQKRPPDPNDPNQPNPGNPGDVPPAAPAPATYTDVPVTAAPTTAPPPPPAGRKPWVDMKVENVQQKVPEAVARAVNKEFNDPNGIDAQDAYAGTSGQETEDKRWVSVDSSNVNTDDKTTPNVNTGDVVKWTNTATGEMLSGIVVVNGDDLQLVTHGKLIALDLTNPPAAGSGPYEFVGFFHPTGLDGDEAPATKPPAPPTINTVTPPAPAPPSAPTAPAPPPRT